MGRWHRWVSVGLFAAMVGSSMVACTVEAPSQSTAGASSKKKKAPAPATPAGDEADDSVLTPSSSDPASSPSAPTLESVTPDAVTLGTATAPVELTITGSHFVAGSKVDIAGTSLIAELKSPNTVRTLVPPELLRAGGVLRLSVFSPAGVESNALTFTVASPQSVSVRKISPLNAVLPMAALDLTVEGEGFVPSSSVKFNGKALTTTFVSANKLTAILPAATTSAAGKFSITVSNSASVVSLPSVFEALNPLPTVQSLSPTRATAGGSATTVTVRGTKFARTSTVLAGNTALTTTFVSDTELRATLTAALLRAGTLTLAVKNPAPGGGTSTTTQRFTVDAAPATCEYKCVDYGYKPGECFEGWDCSATDGCLRKTATGKCAAPPPVCQYYCLDYLYLPNDCFDGYYCVPDGAQAGCLVEAPCY